MIAPLCAPSSLLPSGPLILLAHVAIALACGQTHSRRLQGRLEPTGLLRQKRSPPARLSVFRREERKEGLAIFERHFRSSASALPRAFSNWVSARIYRSPARLGLEVEGVHPFSGESWGWRRE